MKVTVNSLKDLYVSLGGQLTDTFKDIAGGVPVADYTTIPDVIEACSQIAGSTIELPAVSGVDDGKVLKVIDGKWAKGTDESLPAVTAEDAGKTLLVGRSGPSTAEWQVGSVFKTMTFSNLSTDGDGKVGSLGASGVALNNAKILNVRFSESYTAQPTDYNVEVRQSYNSQSHITTNDFYIKASGSAWANKSGISIDVTYI